MALRASMRRLGDLKPGVRTGVRSPRRRRGRDADRGRYAAPRRLRRGLSRRRVAATPRPRPRHGHSADIRSIDPARLPGPTSPGDLVEEEAQAWRDGRHDDADDLALRAPADPIAVRAARRRRGNPVPSRPVVSPCRLAAPRPPRGAESGRHGATPREPRERRAAATGSGPRGAPAAATRRPRGVAPAPPGGARSSVGRRGRRGERRRRRGPRAQTVCGRTARRRARRRRATARPVRRRRATARPVRRIVTAQVLAGELHEQLPEFVGRWAGHRRARGHRRVGGLVF